MKTLFTINIRVTRPYPTDDDGVIKKDFAESLTNGLKELIKAELDHLEIVGLNVEVKVR